MKKLLLFFLLFITTSANAWERYMDKCIASWIGYPLESVIKRWGYPDQEKVIAGKKLYIWETYDYDTNVSPAGGFSVTSIDKKGRETIFSAGGETVIDYCRKTLEVNNNNIVINGEWKGNDCPQFYTFGKKFVNPQNDEWAKKKAEKNK